MRFFLVGQHRETGDVSLVSQQTYESRQEALDDLGAAVPADGSLAGNDLFVIDLDAATPVVVYRAPAAVPEPVAEEPIADVWEAPEAAVDALAEIVAVEEAALEGPPPLWGFDESGQPLESEQAAADVESTPDGSAAAVAEPSSPLWAVAEELELDTGTAEPALDAVQEVADLQVEPEVPLVDDQAESLDLAEALRRAAAQMESEGVVPAPDVDELAAQVHVVPEEPAAEAPASASIDASVPDTAPSAWPWEAAENAAPVVDIAPEQDAAVEGGVAAEEPGLQAAEPVPVFMPVGIDEPGLEDIALLTPTNADAFSEPRPVIVGEYPDVEPAAVDVSDAAVEPEFVVEPELMLESEPASDTPAYPDIASDGESAAVESPFGEVAAAVAAAHDESEAVVHTAEVKSYEPGGMEIASYTCDDCVYVETCPKAKQEGPATCGSFQWKSV